MKVFSPGFERQEEINESLKDIQNENLIKHVPGHPGCFKFVGMELALRRGIQMGQQDVINILKSKYPKAARDILIAFPFLEK